MKVLHILTSGHAGGIETLCREVGKNSRHENGFCFMSFGGEIYEQMERLGITVYPIYKLGKKWSVKKLDVLVKVAQKYDVLIVHNEDPFMELYFLFAKRFARILGVRYVHSCYGDNMQTDGNFIKRKLKHVVMQSSLSAAERIVFVSKAGKQSCQKICKFDNAKSYVIYNGISTHYIAEGNRNELDFKANPIEILYVGRLSPIKGVAFLIKAVNELKGKYNLRLSIVGDGTERQELEKMVDGSTIFYGVQTDIIPFMKKANIFVYPSICQEVFGISIVEAMAFGIPCIGNRVGGIPEIIEDGVNGLLTTNTDTDGIKECLVEMLEIFRDLQKAEDMSQSAKQQAKRFSIVNTCNQLDEMLQMMKQK